MNSCLTDATRDSGGFQEDLDHTFLCHGSDAVVATDLLILGDVGEAPCKVLFDRDALPQPTNGSLMVRARTQLTRMPEPISIKSNQMLGIWSISMAMHCEPAVTNGETIGGGDDGR